MQTAPAPALDMLPDEGAPTQAERLIGKFLPSLADVLFICVLLTGVFGLRGRVLGVDGDAGWNLRLGDIILTSGLPRTEPLLRPDLGHPTVHWEWLAQVLYALANRFGGLTAVVALASLFVALTGYSLYIVLRRYSLPFVLAALLAIAGLVLISITWTARAQLFSLLLSLWWAEWIRRYWRDGQRWRLWCFPPAMALWANLHGGFLGGLILLCTAAGVAWLFPRNRGKARPRDLTLALAATCLATLCTPWGLQLYTHILTYARNPLIAAHTQEYQSPDFHQFYALLFAALLALLVAAWLWRAAKSGPSGSARALPDPLSVANVVVWTYLALTAVRFVPIWAVVVLPILAEAVLNAWHAEPQHGLVQVEHTSTAQTRLLSWGRSTLLELSRRLERTDGLVGKGLWSCFAVVLLAIVIGPLGGHISGTSSALPGSAFDANVFPVRAVARLQATGLPPGNGFNTYEWGGYLDYALPQYHVFIDSRSDVYSEQLLRDYMTITDLGPGWDQLLAQYQIQWALLPTRAPLAQVLARTTGWSCSAADDAGVAELCLRTAGP